MHAVDPILVSVQLFDLGRQRMKRICLCLFLMASIPLAYGDQYEDGVRFLKEKSYAKAAAAFQASAATGNPAAERQIGLMYLQGLGFKQDLSESLKWTERAGAHGDLDAQINLASMYQQGLGVAQSNSRSAHWYRLAAEQGDRASQVRLGEIYFLGTGVSRDRAEAAKWWYLAMQPDDDVAKVIHQTLQSDMQRISPKESEEGRSRAVKWSAGRGPGK